MLLLMLMLLLLLMLLMLVLMLMLDGRASFAGKGGLQRHDSLCIGH